MSINQVTIYDETLSIYEALMKLCGELRELQQDYVSSDELIDSQELQDTDFTIKLEMLEDRILHNIEQIAIDGFYVQDPTTGIRPVPASEAIANVYDVLKDRLAVTAQEWQDLVAPNYTAQQLADMGYSARDFALGNREIFDVEWEEVPE
jgi:hypothetical protein